MWEFLTEMGKEHGLAAVIALLVIIVFAVAIRTLWNKNQSLYVQLREQAELHAKQLLAMSRRVDELQEQRVAEGREMQERRNTEVRADLQKVMTYIGSVDRFVSKQEAVVTKLETAIHILIQAGKG